MVAEPPPFLDCFMGERGRFALGEMGFACCDESRDFIDEEVLMDDLGPEVGSRRVGGENCTVLDANVDAIVGAIVDAIVGAIVDAILFR